MHELSASQSRFRPVALLLTVKGYGTLLNQHLLNEQDVWSALVLHSASLSSQ